MHPGQAVRVPLAGAVYLLLENRARAEFDNSLPAEGLLVWRVTAKGSKVLPTDASGEIAVDGVRIHGIGSDSRGSIRFQIDKTR